MERVPQVVILGAGPAGMVLAYQLASNGIPVRVLERHEDFEREFRGELIQSHVRVPLERLGIVHLLEERGLARTRVLRRLFVGKTRQVKVPGGSEPGSLISQAGLLQLLHEQCSRFPNYRMDFSTTAMGTVTEGGRVVAVKTRSGGVEGRVDGDLFVVTNGRSSLFRKEVGLEVQQFAMPADTLWLRFDFSEAPDARPQGVDVHMFGRGVVAVFFPTTGNRLQVAYSAPGDMGALRKNLPELRRRLLPCVPEPMHALIAARLDERTESQVLKVAVDRVTRWHAPGILFLGDAAHTLSPAGGIGLNLAIRDSFVAANHLIAAVKEGRAIDAAVFQRIEDERRPEIEAIQAQQARIHRMVLAPIAIEHVMFTMLGFVVSRMEKSGKTPPGLPVIEPKFGVPVT